MSDMSKHIHIWEKHFQIIREKMVFFMLSHYISIYNRKKLIFRRERYNAMINEI